MSYRLKALLYKVIFFIGWVLSPFTPWNDIFVNIPVAYFLGNIAVKFFPINFFTAVIVTYWLTNLLGIGIMIASGRNILNSGVSGSKEFFKILLAITIYSGLLVLLNFTGILRPIVVKV